jgi:hypothetical protein
MSQTDKQLWLARIARALEELKRASQTGNATQEIARESRPARPEDK